ncbi:putative ABC transporter ATP-binding protein YjjK [Clostridium homopropionicum DSM 5847]|uniref:Putative ABC transporter ATP-binding protein YjjK n=1 Tax=Clostridium homopropionicum DSM 5847 TaxID=1121318 RepID=A0A0L6ZBX5_9CLOT|nr:ABC-F family ATP-binding cassette domain-containing protein [Clostridium homopropionicum]KOA20471.1 putative ABC transporter ATP-binding protein YjjK [Clostridium homopropionicum DSM 5847]SFG36044.1 ATP-binding cassette, subfamily F, uup [Clostridium homopropionicum]
MNLLAIDSLSKSYGEKVLFNSISFNISDKDKIGIIGINGTGKSTLLRILSGEEYYDSGKIIKSSNLKVEYLPQNVDFNSKSTVLEQIFKTNSPIMKLISQYENILDKLNNQPENVKLQNDLMEVSNKMDSLNAWELKSKAKIVLTKLGINNFEAKIASLSGGQKKRVALASVLINPCELLILDEPTNHIDNDTVDWLEDYLNNFNGAVLMITHDRYFLDRVTNRILEISNGNLYSYSGNYSMFLDSKIQREQLIEAKEDKRRNILRRELEWIRRGAKARTTKQKARIERFEELSSQNSEVQNDKIEISLSTSRLGKKIIELNNISKSYEEKKLINNFSYIFTKNDRVGIVGSNGLGKSTLLNLISGNIKEDSGKIDIGETVKISYFSQECKDMNENLRVIEYIKEQAEYIKTFDGTMISASKMLEKFLFSPNLQYSYISKLSGGERRRLYLLKILMNSPNVLLLDEPTNDLDIETLNILEDYIEFFNGTVIIVSHDRFFLDKTCNKIISFKGNGVINYYVGNYSECKEFLKPSEQETDCKNKSKENIVKTNEKRSLKFSYNEKREYEKIEGNIEKLENELEEIEENIKLSSTDYAVLEQLLEKKERVEEELLQMMERWEYLNEIAEKINNSK